MRTYRIAWTWTAALTTSVAAVVASHTMGAAPLVAVIVTLALFGASVGFAWPESRQERLRLARVCSAWFAAAAVIVAGLPPLLGGWSLLVMVVLGAGAPWLVESAVDAVRRWKPVRPTDHPERLSDRDLIRRWRASQAELQQCGTSSSAALSLVQERARLLDEVQRRDPVGFEAWCGRAVSREPQER